MTPNFALSLSFDGIRLLHRVPGGWHLAGEVALDSSDLAAELADLRRTAMALDPSGIRSKILLPQDQIRYIAIDTTRATEEDVRATLEGATPYAVDELVYDFTRGGGRTYIAAVARETLDEAEDFAAEHGFNPVSFAAVPEPFTFAGEPFFGRAKAAATGAKVDRDTQPVEVIGVSEVLTKPEPGTVEAPKVATDPEPEAQADTAPDEKTGIAASPEPDETSGDAPKPDLETEPEQAAETEASKPATDTPPSAEPASDPVDDADDTPEPEAPSEPEPEAPAVTFASRAKPSSGPVAARTGAPRTAPPVKVEGDQPVFASRTKPVFSVPKSETSQSGADTEAMPDILPKDKAPKAPVPDRGTDGDNTSSTPLPSVLPKTAPAPAAPGSAPVGNPFANSGLTGTEAAADRQPVAKATVAENLTVFGARKPARRSGVGGKPKFLGLILTLILLAFLAAMAIWAAMLPSVTSFLGFGGSGTELVQAPVVETTTGLSASGNVVADLPASDDEALADAGGAVLPEEPAAFAPDTGLGLEAVTAEAVAALTQSLGPIEPQVAEIPADSAPVEVTAAEPAGQILSPAEAQRIYAATGVWQRAPRLPFLPRTESADDVFVAAIDPVTVGTDAIALPSLALSAPDVGLPAQILPPAFGTVFERDDRGLIVATADGTLLPSGVLVYAGRPAVTPPIRPGTAPTTSETTPDNEAQTDETATTAAAPVGPQTTPSGAAFADFRPRGRPLDFTDQIERDTLGGLTVDELASLRPQVRPEGLAPALAPETTAAVDEAIAEAAGFADASDLAVEASVVPEARPRNFDQLVAAARARTASQAASASTANVVQENDEPEDTNEIEVSSVPSGPTPGGVARAATEDGVLSLRQISLLGVAGATNNRSALIRLANGRIVKVSVGDTFDGGQVTAIGDNVINYVKRGRTYALQIP